MSKICQTQGQTEGSSNLPNLKFPLLFQLLWIPAEPIFLHLDLPRLQPAEQRVRRGQRGGQQRLEGVRRQRRQVQQQGGRDSIYHITQAFRWAFMICAWMKGGCWSSVYSMSCQLRDIGCTEDQLSNSSLFPSSVYDEISNAALSYQDFTQE